MSRFLRSLISISLDSSLCHSRLLSARLISELCHTLWVINFSIELRHPDLRELSFIDLTATISRFTYSISTSSPVISIFSFFFSPFFSLSSPLLCCNFCCYWEWGGLPYPLCWVKLWFTGFELPLSLVWCRFAGAAGAISSFRLPSFKLIILT